MITRQSLADEIDIYDQSIADMNAGKKDCFDAYRDQMLAAGIAKPNIKKEIEAVKEAIRRRRLVVKDRDAVEEKNALVDEILEEITAPARAPRARVENIEQFPPHDPETGELTQTQEQPESPAAQTPSSAPRMAADDEAAQTQTSSAPLSLTRTPPVVDDGQPSPSANVPPAQNASSRSDVGQAASTGGHSSGEFAQQPVSAVQARNEPGSASGASVTLPQSEIPAFLRKTIADYRPNCLHPDTCAASGLRHCNACTKAMEAAEREVA